VERRRNGGPERAVVDQLSRAPAVGFSPKEQSRSRCRFGDEAGADATRGIDEALQTISELELRRRFRVDPAEGPAIDLQEEGFNLNGGLAFLVARPEPRRPPRKSPFPER
jgi:hypothetical protein